MSIHPSAPFAAQPEDNDAEMICHRRTRAFCLPGPLATIGPMFAAPVWHYWIGVLIFVPVLLITIGFTVAFLRKTQSPRYGRDD